MDYTAEQLNNAFARLSPEKNRAIFDINVDSQIKDISKKYNLGINTATLLKFYTYIFIVNLLNENDFIEIITKELEAPNDICKNIINDVKQMVSEPIKKREEEIMSEDNFLKQNVVFFLDPRFAVLPKETQEAISKSDYQKNIYTIGTKYKLNVEQMGILEDITIKTMLGTVPTIKYEETLASKITIPKEDMNNLVKDINELVFKKIRDLEMNSKEEGGGTIKNYELGIKNENITTTKEEVPLPPYGGTVKNYELGIKNEGILNSVVQTLKTPEVPKIVEQVKIPEVKIPNMMEEKLKGVTVSGNTVSDYSTPKINTPTSTETPASTPKSFDPYREAI